MAANWPRDWSPTPWLEVGPERFCRESLRWLPPPGTAYHVGRTAESGVVRPAVAYLLVAPPVGCPGPRPPFVECMPPPEPPFQPRDPREWRAYLPLGEAWGGAFTVGGAASPGPQSAEDFLAAWQRFGPGLGSGGSVPLECRPRAVVNTLRSRLLALTIIQDAAYFALRGAYFDSFAHMRWEAIEPLEWRRRLVLRTLGLPPDLLVRDPPAVGRRAELRLVAVWPEGERSLPRQGRCGGP